mmetsp:Transcript_10014/g.28002  ORF Transcript_10014/g.28002 Transcript_10014/m.28002 type:complete len:221 (+) Transcript_10014:307-969(+)
MFCAERQVPVDDLEEHDSVGVDVNLLAVIRALEHLRGHPSYCANKLSHLAPNSVRLPGPRQPKVGNLHMRDVTLRSDRALQEQVQRLQVAVDDRRVQAVEALHAARNVAAHLEALRPGQLSVRLVQEVVAGSAFAVLHDNLERPRPQRNAKKPHEVGVLDLGEGRHLAVEAPVHGMAALQLLDGNGPTLVHALEDLRRLPISHNLSEHKVTRVDIFSPGV